MIPTAWELSPKCSLEDVIHWCLEHHQVDRLLVSARMEKERGRWRMQTPSIESRIRQIFGSHLLEQFVTKGWPGTQLCGEAKGCVFICDFNENVAETLLKTEPTLHEWLEIHTPALPEDLCLFRQGASHPSFISVTHERDAYVLSDTKPDIAGVEKSDLVDVLHYVFPGKCFCDTKL